MVLQINNLNKAYGPHQILSDIALIINRGERIGLVGANGVGKSTLLRLIIGQEQADTGTIRWGEGCEYGYLTQQLITPSAINVEQLLAASQQQLSQLGQQLEQLSSQMAHANPDQLADLLERYGDVAEHFELRGGYELDYRIDQVLEGLGLSHLPRERSVQALSGGEKTRLGLAALLISNPDVLLLDEPTNHLDHQASAWLETWLQAHSGAMLVVSHDRAFLDQVATTIIELDEHTHQLKTYPGNYSAYFAAKQAERERWEADYQRQQAEIRQLQIRAKAQNQQIAHNRAPRDNDGFIYHSKGENVAAAVSRNLRSAQQALERILADPIPEPPKPLAINPTFNPSPDGSQQMLSIEGLRYQREQQPILEQIDLELRPRQRILITGANGSGKTTLLDLIAGDLQPSTGQIRYGPNLQIGYLRQEYQRPKPEQSLFEAYREGLLGFNKDLINELVWSGLFRYAEVNRAVGSISTGQLHKLQLARLIALRANLLLLDEPTNHLSFDVLEQFEAALNQFAGPIIAVSHDRRFIQQFAGEIWHLQQGRLTRLC